MSSLPLSLLGKGSFIMMMAHLRTKRTSCVDLFVSEMSCFFAMLVFDKSYSRSI